MKGSSGKMIKAAITMSELEGGGLSRGARRLGEILSGKLPRGTDISKGGLRQAAQLVKKEVDDIILTPLGAARQAAAKQRASMELDRASGAKRFRTGHSMIYGLTAKSGYAVMRGKIAEMRLEDLLPFQWRTNRAAIGTLKGMAGIIAEHTRHMTRRQFFQLIGRDMQRLAGRRMRLNKLRDLMVPPGTMQNWSWKYPVVLAKGRAPWSTFDTSKGVKRIWNNRKRKWEVGEPRALTNEERMQETRKQMIDFFASRESSRLDDLVRPWDTQRQKFSAKFFADMEAGSKRLGLRSRGVLKKSRAERLKAAEDLDYEWDPKEERLVQAMEKRAFDKGLKKAKKVLGPRPHETHLGDIGEEFGWGRAQYDYEDIVKEIGKKAGFDPRDLPETY